jgi:hypothetical protein
LRVWFIVHLSIHLLVFRDISIADPRERLARLEGGARFGH